MLYEVISLIAVGGLLIALTIVSLFVWKNSLLNSLLQFIIQLSLLLLLYDETFLQIEGELNFSFLVLKWGVLWIAVIASTMNLAIFTNLVMFRLIKMKKKIRSEYFPKLTVRKMLLGLGLIIPTLTVGIVANIQGAYHQEILIQPQDYQAEISFWGDWDYDLYSDAQKTALNSYNATIINYAYVNMWNPVKKQAFVDNLLLWRNNYPGVRFMATLHGYVRINNTGDVETDFHRSAFPYDGSAEYVALLGKEYIETAAAENLTNFVGINSDQESPDEIMAEEFGIDIGPNTTRHSESIEFHNSFFSWVETYYPNMLLTTTMGPRSTVDAIDGDNDLQILDRWNLYDVDAWDEIAPMIYRCGMDGERPFGDLPRPKAGDEGYPSSWVYSHLRLLTENLKLVYGNSEKLGVYLGITNCTCYGSDVEQYNREGDFIGYGYNQLVQDALIAKHFGMKTITIFLLNTVPSDQDPAKAYSMGGVFDSYGDDFLDNFMEAINGANSTDSFSIEYYPDFDVTRDMNVDLLYNFRKPWGVLLFLGYCVGLTILILLSNREKWGRINVAKIENRVKDEKK